MLLYNIIDTIYGKNIIKFSNMIFYIFSMIFGWFFIRPDPGV